MVESKGKKSAIDDILGDLSKYSALQQLALGTACGWFTGFITMKAGKLAALTFGGGILLFEIAHHKGYIKINWDKVMKTADDVIDKIDEEVSGKNSSAMDKISKYVDRKLDKAEDALRSNQRRVRKWYHAFINKNGHTGYNLQELHLFVASFTAGLAFGLATA
ncbi:fun14 domain-containing protein, putative [Pediculus humanus corporis]|uniref:Fun14 domain-containing protein, putative n=1 Tax=Pediculus humanus subsp. corporis TaxID=121224 RepID=E0W4E6_PEDHC|nr:fun14 domain-containing protein, putative [Pediculus humanus corporis]EEB20502.1 fun14 domain-containing protein, putative [Pediculus humanus corporis]